MIKPEKYNGLLVSFIVPVYNSELFLCRCVDSILSQGLVEGSYEIILVNDGSTDGSEVRCRNLATQIRSIKVIDQKNLGPSIARNCGILAACGEYVCFVDSDDNLIDGELESVLNYCDGRTDLIRYWCRINWPEKRSNSPAGDGSITFSGSGVDYLRQFGLETFCWNYLYRRAFLIDNDLLFTPGIIGEDFLFMFDVMMRNPGIVSIARQVYDYNVSPGSISTNRNPEHSRRWVKDLMESMSRIVRDLNLFQSSDTVLYDRCRQSLDIKIGSLFSRALSARYTTREFREILSVCQETGLLPQQMKKNPIVSFLSKFPILYPPASLLFRHLFLPFIYPKLNRNGN